MSLVTLSVLAATLGLGFAQSQCNGNSCYNALADYCPTTARSDCASLLPTTTVTIPIAGAARFNLITETVTKTEALGACPPGSTSVTDVGVVKRQAPITISAAPFEQTTLAEEPCTDEASSSSVPSTSSRQIIVPSYAARVPGCGAAAYSSACSCLFGNNPVTTTVVTTVAPGLTLNSTTTVYSFTILPNNCGAITSPTSVATTSSSSQSSSSPTGSLSRQSEAGRGTGSGRLSSTVSSSNSFSLPASTTGPTSSSASLNSSSSLPTSSQTNLNSSNSTPTVISTSSTQPNTTSSQTSSSAKPTFSNCLTNRIVDILTDPENCGACNNTCSGDSPCINGVCVTNTCAGKTCGSFSPCGTGPPNGGCSCYTSSEGDGFCMDDQFCTDLQDCQSSTDCGLGAICAVQTCCGRNVCMSAVCANPVAVLTKLSRRLSLGKKTAGELLTNGKVVGRHGRVRGGGKPGHQ